MYKPKAYEHEYSINVFPEEKYINTVVYKNLLKMPQKRIDNLHNTLSQMYSKNKVRNIFKKYIESNETFYDSVLLLRFDSFNKYHCFSIPKEIIVKKGVYVYSAEKYNRCFINDNFAMCPQEVFIKWFDLYDKLEIYGNDQELEKLVISYGEFFDINSEEILLIKYLYEFNNLNEVNRF